MLERPSKRQKLIKKIKPFQKPNTNSSNDLQKIKIRLIIVGILAVTIFSAISFGFYYMGASQKGESGVSSLTCFDMDFQDGDSINLTNAVSISDGMGLKTNPYHFELTNNCDTPMNYYVILNVKENSFSDDLISVSLDGRIARVLSTKQENTKFDKPAGYSKSYILKKGVLNKDDPISYDARLWINADATYEQVQGKSWEAQIKVVSTVKELEDEILAQGIPNEMMATSSNDKFWQHSSDIKTITFEDTINSKENASYSYDVSELQDGSVMSYLVPTSEDTTKYDLYIQANGNIIANPDSSYLFSPFSKTQNINNLGKLDTSHVINMSNMFASCSSLTSLDLSNFDTSNVTNMIAMFFDCDSLATLDLSNFDTSNVTMMNESNGGMFSGCINLVTLDISNFNTSIITDMSGMFARCNSLTKLDLSSFDTSNVTNMSGMFANCYSLIKLDLSNFDTSNVIDMYGMFLNCSGLTTLDLSSFDTSNVTNMFGIFKTCNKLSTTITIRGIKCTVIKQMFWEAATAENTQIIVNYTADASTLVDDMIATKSSNSNVVKGTQVA